MNNFRGGFGGGNMQALMQQAKKMQEDMAKKQQALAEVEITATSGGGMVEITMTGKKALKSIKLHKNAVDPDDIEMLEDLIIAAFNECMKKCEDAENEALGPMANMLGGNI